MTAGNFYPECWRCRRVPSDEDEREYYGTICAHCLEHLAACEIYEALTLLSCAPGFMAIFSDQATSRCAR